MMMIHTCGKLIVMLISCSTLSCALGRDLHSLVSPPLKTLCTLNRVFLKGSHAEHSPLCNFSVWLDSPTIKIKRRHFRLAMPIDTFYTASCQGNKGFKVAGMKNTGRSPISKSRPKHDCHELFDPVYLLRVRAAIGKRSAKLVRSSRMVAPQRVGH